MEGSKGTFLDVDFETARCLHRVVRAMHDGECPRCHVLLPADAMRYVHGGPTGIETDLRCPKCGFLIRQAEKEAAIAAFAPVMYRNLAVFEEWRKSRA